MSRHSLKHRAEYFLLRSVCSWIRSRSISRGVAIHKGLAKIWFEFVKIRREQTFKNIQIAFPHLSEVEVTNLARAAFLNISRVMVENSILDKIVRSGFDGFIGHGNWQVLEQALNENRGVILLSGHFGNWELGAAIIALKGFSISALVANMRNKLVDNYVRKNRSAAAFSIIELRESKQMIPRKLGEGEVVAIVADQDAGKKGLFVPFFGRLASTHTGPAVYSVRYNAPVVYGLCFRKNDQYNFYFERFEDSSLKQSSKEKVKAITTWFNSCLERDIRKYPDQYFWVHRRWKTSAPQGKTV